MTVQLTGVQPGTPAKISLAVSLTEITINKPVPHVACSVFINGIFSTISKFNSSGKLFQIVELPQQSGTHKITFKLGQDKILGAILGRVSTTISVIQNLLTVSSIDEITGQSLLLPVSVVRQADGTSVQITTPTSLFIPYIVAEQYGIQFPAELVPPDTSGISVNTLPLTPPQYPYGMAIDSSTDTILQIITQDLKVIASYLPFHLLTISNPQAPYTLSSVASARFKQLSRNTYAVIHKGVLNLNTTGPTVPVDGQIYGNGWIIDGVENDQPTVQVTLLNDITATPVAFQWKLGQVVEDDIVDLVQLTKNAIYTSSGNSVTITSVTPGIVLGLSKDYDLSLVDKTLPFILTYGLAFQGGPGCIKDLLGQVKVDILDLVTGEVLHTISDPNSTTISGQLDISQYFTGVSGVTIRASVISCIQHSCEALI